MASELEVGKIVAKKPATTGSSPLEVARLEVEDNGSGVNMNAGIGPKLSFYSPRNTASIEGASIAAKKESGTDDSEATTLAFSTCPVGGTNTERLTINSTGKTTANALKVLDPTHGRYFDFVLDSSASYLDVSHALNVRVNGASSLTNALTISSTGLASFSAGVTVSGGITTLGSFSELTINSGQITVTQSVHTVDTEGDAASDDLETINGGTTGSILVLKSVTGSRHVVLKDGTDNLRLNGDCELGISNDTITLMKVSTVWREMSRSLN